MSENPKVVEQDVTRLMALMPHVIEYGKSHPEFMQQVMGMVADDGVAEGMSGLASHIGMEVAKMIPTGPGFNPENRPVPREPWMALVMQAAVLMTTLNVIGNIIIRTMRQNPAIPMEIAQVMAAKGTEHAMRKIMEGVREAVETAVAAKSGGASA